MKQSQSLVAFVALITFLLGGALLIGGVKDKDKALPKREEIPSINQTDLKDDSSSINTIIYGVKREGSTIVSAINDSGINNTVVTKLAEEVKFLLPLRNGKQILYIADTDDGDYGKFLKIRNIVPDGSDAVIYTPTEGYGIDGLVISEDNKWIAWYEVKPADEEGYTHLDDYYKVYKAKLDKPFSKDGDVLSPEKINEIKSGPGVSVELPTLITNNGKVYLDSIIPYTYALYYGFKDEKKNIVLPLNTYNNKPQLIDQRYLLYTSFESTNSKFPSTDDKDSTRDQVLNTNIIKTFDLESNKITVVAPGDEGEHYKHPVYISGYPDREMAIVAEVHTIQGTGNLKLFPKEVQLIRKNNDGTFAKEVIADISDKKKRILGVGQLPNGDKTVLIGEDSDFRGNLGSGNGVGPSGYVNKLLAIEVYNLSTKELVERITPKGASMFEFISIVPKLPNEKIGIQRDMKLVESLARGVQQLQLQTFVPIEPKRKRKNPRSECEVEWEKKGYPNYEACESCPVYVYSPDNRKITISPITPIVRSSAVPQLTNNAWSLTSNKEGVLTFSDGNHKKIDYDFPRGNISTPEFGIVLDKVNRGHDIVDYAYNLGFNTREVEDIVDFFIEELKDTDYVYFSNLPNTEVNSLLSVNVSPVPDTYISHIFYAKKLSSKSSMDAIPPQFNPQVRKDFAVVIWGSVIE